MILRLIRNKAGQTAIEYLLLIVVSISLGVAFYNKMKDFLLDSPNSVIGKQLKTLSDTLKKDSSGRYRYYGLPK